MDGIDSYFANFTRPDAELRGQAVAGVGDIFRVNRFDEATTARIVRELVAIAVSDDAERVVEEALYALRETDRPLPLALLRPLAEGPADRRGEFLEDVLDILAFTHDPAAEPLISRYLDDPDPGVRRHAAEALVELAGRA